MLEAPADNEEQLKVFRESSEESHLSVSAKFSLSPSTPRTGNMGNPSKPEAGHDLTDSQQQRHLAEESQSEAESSRQRSQMCTGQEGQRMVQFSSKEKDFDCQN